MSACTSASSSSARSSPRTARARPCLALLAGLALLAPSRTSRATSGDEAERARPESAMKDLSGQFRALETRLSAADLAGAARAAGELGAVAARLGALRPEVNGALTDVFEQHVARLDTLAGEIAETAGAGSLEAAGQAFEELRSTCVSCHVRFRANNDERGHHPARDNTLTGVAELRDAEGKLLDDRSWVLVFLEGEHAPFASARRRPVISQKGRRFAPRVLPVIVGTEVEFPNDDTIFHNVFSLSKTAPFDLGVYEPGQTASVRMQRPGLVKVYCNIHPEMAASIVVLDNPWHGLTDRSGRFVLCGIPDGEYVLRAWNDMGAESLPRTVRVRGGGAFEADVALQETRRSVRHSNKYGKPYPEKYE